MRTNYERLYLRLLVELDETINALQARAIGFDFIKEHLDEAIHKIEQAKVLLKVKLYQRWSSPPKEDYPPELDEVSDDDGEGEPDYEYVLDDEPPDVDDNEDYESYDYRPIADCVEDWM